jgi:hypothetical protein
VFVNVCQEGKRESGKEEENKKMKRSYELYDSITAGSGGNLLDSNSGLAGEGFSRNRGCNRSL